MESKRILMISFFLVIFSMGFLCSSTEATNFYVGGKDGWILNPSEDFIHWAHRNRFQVNDTLIFKYKKGSDSVLIVTKEAFEKCNTANPIKSLKDGASTFKIDRSGPWFFISGNQTSCEKGQKVMIVVMSEKHKKSGISSSPQAAPSPTSSIPSSLTPASSPSPTNHGDDHEPPAPAPSSSPYSSGSSIALVSVLVSVMLCCFN